METKASNRLLKDFPELWGVSNEWDPSQITIKVIRNEQEILNILEPYRMRSQKEHEQKNFWIKTTSIKKHIQYLHEIPGFGYYLANEVLVSRFDQVDFIIIETEYRLRYLILVFPKEGASKEFVKAIKAMFKD